jgi:hypothetical protein
MLEQINYSRRSGKQRTKWTNDIRGTLKVSLCDSLRDTQGIKQLRQLIVVVIYLRPFGYIVISDVSRHKI